MQKHKHSAINDLILAEIKASPGIQQIELTTLMTDRYRIPPSSTRYLIINLERKGKIRRELIGGGRVVFLYPAE